jgi:hypothetical protein
LGAGDISGRELTRGCRDLAGEEPAGQALAGEEISGRDLVGEELTGRALAGEELAGCAIPREKLTGRALAGEEQSDRALVGEEHKRGGELKTETYPSGVRGQGGRFTESSSQRDTFAQIQVLSSPMLTTPAPQRRSSPSRTETAENRRTGRLLLGAPVINMSRQGRTYTITFRIPCHGAGAAES